MSHRRKAKQRRAKRKQQQTIISFFEQQLRQQQEEFELARAESQLIREQMQRESDSQIAELLRRK